MTRLEQLEDILDFSRVQLSDMLPSEWAERNMVVQDGKFQGPLSYDRTPFTREIVDCFSPYHYATEVTLVGAAQFGKSTTVVEPIICYNIAENPCNMGFLTGHSDLSDEAMVQLDRAISGANIQHLIMPSVIKAKNSRTGDTNRYKEYQGGSIVAGSATNHKLLRQRRWQTILVDDLEAAKGASRESGSTLSLIRARAKSFGNSKKILWCSTPELLATSLIWPLFLDGDQRRWHWPCPHCDKKIYLQWVAPVAGTDEKAGFTWRVDKSGLLVPGSVEYVCQECGRPFDESRKYELNLAGKWIAQAVAKDPSHVSFHVPGFYALPGQNGWEDVVREYLKANPGGGQPVNKEAMKTFVNLTCGEPYEEDTIDTNAKSIMGNTRLYKPGIVPESVSLADGSGKVVLLTCAADLNGMEDDARLDWEIVAHTTDGGVYSVKHGSIGTFKRGEGAARGKTDREHWTYEFGKERSVWTEFDRILDTVWEVDTGRRMKVYITGLDTSYFTKWAYEFIDRTKHYIVGLKGDTEEKFIRQNLDKRYFKKATVRDDVFIVDVNPVKDLLSERMVLRWDRKQPTQPLGFMNFPEPAEGLYGFENYFSHFESEHKVYKVNNSGNLMVKWEKKRTNVQNHMWDCYIYNIVVREIFLFLLGQSMKPKRADLSWEDWCKI